MITNIGMSDVYNGVGDLCGSCDNTVMQLQCSRVTDRHTYLYTGMSNGTKYTSLYIYVVYYVVVYNTAAAV